MKISTISYNNIVCVCNFEYIMQERGTGERERGRKREREKEREKGEGGREREREREREGEDVSLWKGSYFASCFHREKKSADPMIVSSMNLLMKTGSLSTN